MRLFIAIDLGPELVSRVAQTAQQLAKQAPDAKWVRGDDKFHVTLVFLGHTDEAKLPEVTEALNTVAARHRKLTLAAEGGGAFGPKRAPRVLWVDLTGDVDALASLQAELAARMKALGFELEDRAFRPHLTLARARSPRGDPALAGCAEALAGRRFGAADVREVILFQSRLSPLGAQYTALVRAPLGGA